MKNLVKILSCLIIVGLAISAFGGTKYSKANSSQLNTQTININQTIFNEMITTIKMPNGKMAFYSWKKDSNGKLILESIKFESGRVIRCQSMEDGTPGNVCERAAAATVIAIGVCAVAPSSVGCWAATANAAYLTYLCWQSTRKAGDSIDIAFETEDSKLILNKNKSFKNKSKFVVIGLTHSYENKF